MRWGQDVKKASYIKLVTLLATFAVLISVAVVPAVSLEKKNGTGNSKASGNDFELPFLPKETEHVWDDGTVTTPPTCTEPGVMTYTCKYNANHTYTEEIPEIGHMPDIRLRKNIIAATCTEDGSYEEVVYCSICDEEVSREVKVIPALGHDWNDGTVTKEATCAESGIITYTCKRDPSHTYTEVIPKVAHMPGTAVIENEVFSTCSATGSYDEVEYCSVCGEEIRRESITVPIDADAHDFGEWVQTIAPTETRPGEETRTCKYDPGHTETREIPALGPSQVELTFFEDEVLIVVPNGAIPDGSEFDVQKIVPPPAEVVEKVQEKTGSSSEVLAYYEIRLFNADGTRINRFDGKITIKTKMPEQYAGCNDLRIHQEDETGKLITMRSWWENEYLCYETNWLEIYN